MKSIRLPLVILLCLLFSCGLLRRAPKNFSEVPPDCGDSDAVTYLYTQGVKFMLVEGEEEISSTFYREALRRDSLHAPSYYGLATNLAQKDPRQAIQYAQKACRLDTANIYYITHLGRLYLYNRDYRKALTIFSDLLHRDPQESENYRIVAALYKMNGQPFAAIALLDSVENNMGYNEELSSYKQQLLVETKQYDKAIKQAKALIDAFPYNSDNYLSLADLYVKTDKDSLALENYAKALEIDSTNVDVLVSLNDFYRERDNIEGFTATAKKIFISQEVSLEDKIAFLDEIRSNTEFFRQNFSFIRDLSAKLAVMYHDSLDALMEYVRVLVASDNAEEASKLLKNFMSLKQPPDLEVLNTITGLEAYRQMPDSVEKYMSLALKYYPDNFDLRIQHAMVLAQMKQYDRALASYEDAMRRTRNDSIQGAVYGFMGDLSHEQGNKQKAYDYYDKSLHKYYDNPLVLNNYAYYLSVENKHLDKALKMSKRSLELMAGTPSFLDTYGWILFQTGDYEQARKIIKQAISLDRSNSSELAFHYAEVLYALKDYFMASVYWQKALERGYDKEVIEQRLKLVEGK